MGYFGETYLTIKCSRDITTELYNKWLRRKFSITVNVDSIITTGSSCYVGQYMICNFRPFKACAVEVKPSKRIFKIHRSVVIVCIKLFSISIKWLDHWNNWIITWRISKCAKLTAISVRITFILYQLLEDLLNNFIKDFWV